MVEAAKVIRLIKQTSSTNDKKYLLIKNAGVPDLKEILKFIYNPYCKTGISAAKLKKAKQYAVTCTADARVPKTAPEIIAYLKRHQTGTDNDLMICGYFLAATDDSAQDLAEAILTQDLQIGVTAKTLNAVFGKTFIPTVGCMLGTKIGDLATIKSSAGGSQPRIEWPCIVTEKLDGIRRILIKENGVCRAFSRSGHEDTDLVDILDEAQYLPDNRVYDGELLATGQFADNIAVRQATMSRSAGKGPKHGLTFNVFDMLHIEDFYTGTSDIAYERKAMLAALFNDESLQLLPGYEGKWAQAMSFYAVPHIFQHIKSVPILGVAHSLADAEPMFAAVLSHDGEGVMLNTFNGLYEIKRSKNLIKLKRVEEIVLPVVGVFEGQGRNEGALGGVVVDYKGYKVGVGSGFTDEQRRSVWQNPEKFVGKSIEIDYFGESTNMLGTVSLNCPIFKRFVGDEE